MKHIILNSEQRSRNGATDLIVLKYSDFSTLASGNTTVNVNIGTVDKGDVIMANAILEVHRALAGTLTGDTITLSVGRTSSAYTDVIAAKTIMTTGTAATVDTTFVGVTTNEIIAADSTALYAQFLLTAGSTALTAATDGEFRIYLTIRRRSNRKAVEA